jgi:hypothetical protein
MVPIIIGVAFIYSDEFNEFLNGAI